jgi:predicted RNase H-like nuclease (RuvC/YqgF family)
MNDPLHMLLRVKQLKEDQASRALHAKRQQVNDAKTALDRAREIERANAGTLPAREERIYSGIMSRIVSFDEIEDTKARVKQLQTEHTKLVDAIERAVHVHIRLQNELAEAAEKYRVAVKSKDKYVQLTEQIDGERLSHLAHREEIEVEDLFSNRPRTSP